MGPKNILARHSLAKAKECCLDRFTKVDGQKGEVPSALTKNPVSVRTLCLTTTIQPNSCMVVADLKCTKLSVNKSALCSSQCSTVKTTTFSFTGKSGGRLVEQSNPKHIHHILHRTNLTLLRALLGSVASDPTYYSGGTGSSPVGKDGSSERFPLSRLYWLQSLRRV